MRSGLLLLISIGVVLLAGGGWLLHSGIGAASQASLAPDPAATSTPEDVATAAPGVSLVRLSTVTPRPTTTRTPQPDGTATPVEKEKDSSDSTNVWEAAAATMRAITRTPEPTRTTVPDPSPAAAAQPAAPPATAPQLNLDKPVRIVIESIDLNRELVSVGLDENRVPIVPNHDAAWYNLSATPGTGENVVLWGHVLRFRYAPEIPAPFAQVDELVPGETITLYNARGEAFDYTVSDQLWVKPDQVEFILPQGSERLTLVSCIGNEIIVDGSLQLTHRLITIATPAR